MHFIKYNSVNNLTHAGTGKTYLAAFDVLNFNPKRLLYIVHEGSILMKSVEIFVRKVDNEDGIQLPFTYIGSGKMEYIEGSKKADYSPVILELCRAIENEFLLKIFTKYSMDVIRRKGNRIDTFLAADKASGFLKNKTGMFVKALTKSVRTRKPEYTLGQMNTIMSLVNDTGVVSASPLLQDFRDYLEQEKVISDLLNVQYIRKINDLVEKYRNPAAHPGYMTLDKAQRCREIMPERLDYLMDCLCGKCMR